MIPKSWLQPPDGSPFSLRSPDEWECFLSLNGSYTADDLSDLIDQLTLLRRGLRVFDGMEP